MIAFNKTKYTKGNSITEYLLPAMLLGGVVLGVLATTDWDILGQNYLAETTHGHMQNKTLMINHFGQLDPNTPMPGTEVQGTTGNGNTISDPSICFDGIPTCINIRTIKPGPETVGSLGGDSIDALAAVLEQLPDILADLNVDPSVVDRVTKLASQGHDMAKKLKAIEAICARGKVCTGPESREAQKQLRDLKKGPLGEFLSEWKTLESYMKENPNALAAFPEAYGIIKSRVNNINRILNSLATANLYNQVPKTVTRQKTVQCGDGGTWNCKKTITETVYQPVFKGLSFQSPNVKKVHQNANEICDQGGKQNRCRVQT
jgi:hypothetical protein